MAKKWPPKCCASFLQICRDRCAGAWDVRTWWIPVVQAFTIQTIIHFVCYSLYLLQMNKRLPSMVPPMGMPYVVAMPHFASWMPLLIALYYLLIRAPLVEELRFRGTVWLGLVAFRQRWVHWTIIACASVLWAFLHQRALLGTLEIVSAGFFAGWLVLKTKNIVPSMVFHSAWNAVVLGVAYFGLK